MATEEDFDPEEEIPEIEEPEQEEVVPTWEWLFLDRLDPSTSELNKIEDHVIMDKYASNANLGPRSVKVSLADIISGNESIVNPFSALYFGVDKGVWELSNQIFVSEWSQVSTDRRYFDGVFNVKNLIRDGTTGSDIMSPDVQRVMNKLLRYKMESCLIHNTITATGLVVIDNNPFIGYVELDEALDTLPYYLGVKNAGGVDTYTEHQADYDFGETEFTAKSVMDIKLDRFGLNKVSDLELGLVYDFHNFKLAEGLGADHIDGLYQDESNRAIVDEPTLADLMCLIPVGSVKLSAFDVTSKELGWLVYDQRYVCDVPDIHNAWPEDVYLQCSFTKWRASPAPYPLVRDIPADENITMSWASVGEYWGPS